MNLSLNNITEVKKCKVRQNLTNARNKAQQGGK